MQWVAHYSDETELPQYNADGTENKYADIDRARLQYFEFRDTGRIVLRTYLEPGQRLIYRRRVEKRPGEPDIVVYMAGWQQTIAGQNIQSISYIFPDGAVIQAGRFDEASRWFYSIVPVPCEKDDPTP